jgi:hypothetical protein
MGTSQESLIGFKGGKFKGFSISKTKDVTKTLFLYPKN